VARGERWAGGGVTVGRHFGAGEGGFVGKPTPGLGLFERRDSGKVLSRLT